MLPEHVSGEPKHVQGLLEYVSDYQKSVHKANISSRIIISHNRLSQHNISHDQCSMLRFMTNPTSMYVYMHTALLTHQIIMSYKWDGKASFARIVGADRRCGHLQDK